MRRLVLILTLSLLPALAGAQPADVQALFDKGATAAQAGRHAEAAASLHQALDALRAQGRIGSVDAGLVASRLAVSLEAIGHAQTDEAYEFAARTLEPARDPLPFARSAAALIRRRLDAGAADKAEWVVEKLLARTARDGVAEETRIEAVRVAIGYFNRIGRKDRAQETFRTLADLTGQGKELSGWRGLILFERAQQQQAAGRVAAARASLAQAIADLRRADETRSLAAALILTGRMDYLDGAYRAALPAFEEAEALLRPLPDDTRLWLEAIGYRARLLERLDRTEDAARAAEAMAREAEARTGADSAEAVAARLDQAHFLLRARRKDEARALLQAEAERLGGAADPLIAGLFYDRLAGLRLADEDYDGAREAAAEALRIFRQHRPDEPGLRLEPARKLAEALAARADHAAAEQALKDMIATTEQVFAPGHPEVARDLNAYALFLRERDRLPETEKAQRRVVEILAAAYGETSPKYAYALTNLAVTLTALDRPAEAIAPLRRAADILGAAPGLESERIGALASLAGAQRAMGQPRAALKTLDEAVRISQETADLALGYETSLLIDGNAIAALYDIDAHDEAWRIASAMLARRGKASRADAANLNHLLLIAALVADARGDSAAALDLVRQAGAGARAIGQSDRRFVDEWAGLIARYAFEAGEKPR